MVSFANYDRARLRRIADYVAGPDVLDIGYAQFPNPFLRAERRVGLDLNPADCDYEEQIVGDALALEAALAGRVFDTIIAAEFIEHVENPYAFLRSLRAFLKPGGRIILSTPNAVGFPAVLLEWARSRRFFYTDEHKYYFAPRWVERLVVHSGYRMERIVGVGIWPFGVLGAGPHALSYQIVYVCAPA